MLGLDSAGPAKRRVPIARAGPARGRASESSLVNRVVDEFAISCRLEEYLTACPSHGRSLVDHTLGVHSLRATWLQSFGDGVNEDRGTGRGAGPAHLVQSLSSAGLA